MKLEEKVKENEIRILRPFGPAIAVVKMPIDIIDKLNSYVDKIILDEEKTKNLNHGDKLAGNVTQEFKLEQSFMKEIGWANFLGKGVQNWLARTTGKQLSKFNLIESWIVRQFKNEYNPLHWHSGHVSGVGYLKVPDNLGDQIQKDKKANLNGHLQLIHGNKLFNCQSEIHFKPEVGNFYFFPNYLMHTVYPFTDSNQERRSISFNANIDNDIYNVYG